MSILRRCLATQARRISNLSRVREPLRILFCGSDAFSIHSLRALNAYRLASPNVVESIDVICRNDKRTGRGLKQVRAVPIKAVSRELGLPLQQLDTFEGWQPANDTPNLVVTASFGLLVPADILSKARYGGLNVHPSLLPQFRGAAPIQHAIMKQVKTTGVSVQTMHPTKFDHGEVLVQESYAIGEQGASTLDLIEALGPIGGRLLVESIDKGLYLEPRPVESVQDVPLFKAPKIRSADRMLDWSSWSSKDIIAHDRALDNLWDRSTASKYMDIKNTSGRIVFNGPWQVLATKDGSGLSAGDAHLVDLPDQTRVAFKTIDGCSISPRSATIEGDQKLRGLATLRRLLEVRRQSSHSS